MARGEVNTSSSSKSEYSDSESPGTSPYTSTFITGAASSTTWKTGPGLKPEIAGGEDVNSYSSESDSAESESSGIFESIFAILKTLLYLVVS